MEGLNHFQNRIGVYDRSLIWVSAARDDCEAHRWHQRDSLGNRTVCFGKLACVVTSKPGDGGTCERNWKQYKQAKSGKRNKMTDEKTKKQVTVYGRNMLAKSQLRAARLATAHKLWDEGDFETLKLDHLGRETTSQVKKNSNKPSRIFRAWEESWEKVKLGSKGDRLLEERLCRKYGGLQWVDG